MGVFQACTRALSVAGIIWVLLLCGVSCGSGSPTDVNKSVDYTMRHYWGTLYLDNDHSGSYNAGDELLPNGLIGELDAIEHGYPASCYDEDHYDTLAWSYTSGSSAYSFYLSDYYAVLEDEYDFYLRAPLCPSGCLGYRPDPVRVYMNVDIHQNFGAQPGL